MKWSYFFLFLLIIPSLMSCETERQKLHKEVIAIHDEVMPMIPDIKKNKSKIAEMIKSANEAKDTVNQIKCEKAYYLLNQADEAMFGWMAQFADHNPDESVADDKAIEILNKQKESATRMRDLMLKNVKEAGELLE